MVTLTHDLFVSSLLNLSSLSLSDPRPSNVLLKKLKPSVWFAFITVLVGVCMAAQGLVRNNGQLIATRVLLGVVEAGLYPGCNFLMSGWVSESRTESHDFHT